MPIPDLNPAGVHKIRENLFQIGRTLIITEPDLSKLTWSEVPLGTIHVNYINGIVSLKISGEPFWIPATIEDAAVIDLIRILGDPANIDKKFASEVGPEEQTNLAKAINFLFRHFLRLDKLQGATIKTKIDNALLKTSNLTDVNDPILAAQNLGVAGNNVTTHAHDGRYMPGLIIEERTRQEEDKRNLDLIAGLGIRLDQHTGESGTEHEVATTLKAGFATPADNATLNSLALHLTEESRITNVNSTEDGRIAHVQEETDLACLSDLTAQRDFKRLRVGKYRTSVDGSQALTLDFTSWSDEWDADWLIRFPDKPNPGFMITVIPTAHLLYGGTVGHYGTYTVGIGLIGVYRNSDTSITVQMTESGGHYWSSASSILDCTVFGGPKDLLKSDNT